MAVKLGEHEVLGILCGSNTAPSAFDMLVSFSIAGSLSRLDNNALGILTTTTLKGGRGVFELVSIRSWYHPTNTRFYTKGTP